MSLNTRDKVWGNELLMQIGVKLEELALLDLNIKSMSAVLLLSQDLSKLQTLIEDNEDDTANLVKELTHA